MKFLHWDQGPHLCHRSRAGLLCFAAGMGGGRRLIRAFTLLEVLMAVLIIGLLSTLVVAGVGKARTFVAQAGEVTAARNLIAAFQAASADQGQVFSSNDRTRTLYSLNGTEIGKGFGGIYSSYVFYLLPYLDYEIKGTIIVNDEQRDVIEEYAKSYADNRDYALSIYPALGMSPWIGGDYDDQGNLLNGSYALTRMDEAVNPGDLIVFASAGTRQSWPRTMTVHGHYRVNSPLNMSTADSWGTKPNIENPARNGYVHFRWEERAVVAHLDGSVRLMTLDQMRDMRRWANPAALADDPYWFRGK